MKKLVLTCALLLSATKAQAYFDSYGAIYYSTTTGAFGWSRGWATLYEAEVEALSHCWAADCQRHVWFKNGCGALAASIYNKGVTGWSISTSLYSAQQRALVECSLRGIGCAVVTSACSP